MATKIKIIEGPSRFDLMLAIFDYRKQRPRSLELKVKVEDGPEFRRGLYPRHLNVHAVCRYSLDSTDSWLIEGDLVLGNLPFEGSGLMPVLGRYNTRTRKGWLKALWQTKRKRTRYKH